MNGLFEYELLLKTPDDLNFGASGAADFDLDAFIGREISCAIELDGSGVRQINALITDAALWGEEGRHVQYKLTLRPWLHLATLSTDCKIFQDKTVVQILDELLADYAFPVDKRLFETYPPRDFQTQFNETDFDFFSRLCEEWGLSYHFEHVEDKHRLVLSDAMGAYKAAESAAYREVAYHAPGWKIDAEYISSFAPHSHLTSGQYSSRDYDYTRPRADLSVGRKDPRPTGQSDGEVYQWHASHAGSHYAQPRAGAGEANDPQGEGRLLALLRIQALRTHGERAQANGNLRGMVPGSTFQLRNHPRQKANAEYLVLDTRFVIEDVAQDSQNKDAVRDRQQQWRVHVDFTAHPVAQPLRPVPARGKPQTGGPQSALVVGPEGQNLWTDELGRIKVQFHWDQLGRKNQHSTCWLRVSSPWAGNQLGGIHLPRIGQEVIVDFFGGDPDLPICTGRVHNQSNLPPWALPGQSALSGFRSRELSKEGGNSAAGRSNHLLMDDTAGRIQVQLKSDHQHSQLSLGHITRIEDNAGRKDARGEGFELRTDGHGVLRAKDGLLITTEPRPKAEAHGTDMGETIARLARGGGLQESLGIAAREAEAQEEGDQGMVVRALKAQNDAIKGVVHPEAEHFPELTEPHLVLASPAGIESTSARSTHVHAGEHIALASERHTSISTGESFLASARQAVRLFAYRLGMRFVAYGGDIEIKALKDSIRVMAQLDITQTAESISIAARKELRLNGGGSYLKLNAGGIEGGTQGLHRVFAASHGMQGPRSIDEVHPIPLNASLSERKHMLEEHFVLLEHAGGLRLPQQKYRIAFTGGRTVEGKTNDDGETEVVQSMVHQIATVEVLRNAEDGVLASYTPFVQTPAEQAYAGPGVVAEKREQPVGSKKHKVNADEPTSNGKAPVHTSCDPNNWGLRKSNPKLSDATRWEYPVASAFVNGIKKALTGDAAKSVKGEKPQPRIKWEDATWPLSSQDQDSLDSIVNTHTGIALRKTAFGLPEGAQPKLVFLDDKNSKEFGVNSSDLSLKGVMNATRWILLVCKGGIASILSAAKLGIDSDDFQTSVREFASSLYHEARHAQQYFWVIAMVQQFPQSYEALPFIRTFWRDSVPAKIFELAAACPVPDEPSARAGLHRMVIAMYYKELINADASNKRHPDKVGYHPEILASEIPLARKAAYDLLQDVGLGGLSIDVDAMAKGASGSPGYRMQPWEEDSFAIEEVVKRLWDGDASSLLPEPGFCTTLLRVIVESRGKGTAGETRHAN